MEIKTWVQKELAHGRPVRVAEGWMGLNDYGDPYLIGFVIFFDETRKDGKWLYDGHEWFPDKSNDEIWSNSNHLLIKLDSWEAWRVFYCREDLKRYLSKTFDKNEDYIHFEDTVKDGARGRIRISMIGEVGNWRQVGI